MPAGYKHAEDEGGHHWRETGSLQSWDVTSVVNGAYLNHNLLFSLLFRADDESPGAAPVTNNNLEYFASREFAPANAFRIDVQVRAVPEPSAGLLMATALAGAIARKRRRHPSAAGKSA